MRSAALLLFLMAAPTQAEPPTCYTGDVKTADGHTLTKGQLLHVADALMSATFMQMYNSDADLKAFMDSRGMCQHQCVSDMVDATLENLYGKLGQGIMNEDDATKSIAVEALTGAFRACYPSPPRDQVKSMMTTLVENMGNAAPAGDPGHPGGVACPNDPNLFDVDGATSDFETAIQQVIASTPTLKTFIETKTKACQFACADKTVTTSALTLYAAGIDDEDKSIDALTGAIHACFPGLDHDDTKQMVTQAAQIMSAASSSARLRLYNSKMPSLATGASFFPMCGLAVAAGLVLFAAGVAVGRRSQKPRIVRETDETGLIASEPMD